MFKDFLGILQTLTFWFIFICCASLLFSVFLFLIGIVPSDFLLKLDAIALLWCYAAGVLPIIWMGLLKIKNAILRAGDES